MALVNYERRFIYLMEPHMASRATVDAVMKYIPKTGNVGHHHINLDELLNWRRQHIDPKQVEGFRILATVRNPFDTLVTRWRQGALKNEPIRDGVSRLSEDHPILKPARGLYLNASHVLVYEDLENDLRWIFNQPDLELGYNPMHRTAGKAAWNEYYDEETFDKLSNRSDWKRYMESYGYKVYFDGTVEIDRSTRAIITRQL